MAQKRAKFKDIVADNSDMNQRKRNRECTIIRESRNKKKYIVIWDGSSAPQYVIKTFLSIINPTTNDKR